MYTDIDEKQNPVKQESDPNEGTKPEGESVHDGGADYDCLTHHKMQKKNAANHYVRF